MAGEPHPRVGRKSTISDLPDEILDVMIKMLGETHDLRRYIPSKLNRGDWPSCILVCRRWYRITLPHLFRCVQVPVFGDCPSFKYTVGFRRFLEESADIAQCIQGLIVGETYADIHDFYSTLDSLVNLRYLEISLTMFYPNKNGSHNQALGVISRDRTLRLDKMVYCSWSDESLVVTANNLVTILAPYAKIERITISSVFALADVEHTTEPVQCTGNEPEVLELDLLAIAFASRGIQALRAAISFDYLSCLSVKLEVRVTPYKTRETATEDVNEASRTLAELFRMVSGTLRELYIQFGMDDTTDLLDEHLALDILCGGLELCTLLHGFHLKVDHMSIRMESQTAMIQLVSRNWSLGLEMLSRITHNTLKHVSYIYETRLDPDPDFQRVPSLIAVVSPLNWSRLHQVCARLKASDLRSIRIDFRSPYGLTCWPFGLASPERSGNDIRRDLPDLDDVLLLCESTNSRGLCKDLPCRWGEKWPEEYRNPLVTAKFRFP